MPAGEWTRVTTEVRNTGSDDLTWFHDGCATLVHVLGEMPDAPWRPGVEQVGVDLEFKERALFLAYRSDRRSHPLVRFVPEERINIGSMGCADVGISEVISPGESQRDERTWDGSSTFRWGPPPSRPIILTGTFQYYSRDGRRDGPGSELSVPLDAWITGGADETWLSPPEVVDAALADDDFAEFLETQDLGNSREEILWYRPELGAWEVGVLEWTHPGGELHLVLIDAHTGDVLDTVDRPWDEGRDGFP